MTEDGQVISLSGDGFQLDGLDLDMLGNNVLFSMNNDISQSGIQMGGWKIDVNGSVHSNTNLIANCSEFIVSDAFTSVTSPIFNTWQTHLG